MKVKPWTWALLKQSGAFFTVILGTCSGVVSLVDISLQSRRYIFETTLFLAMMVYLGLLTRANLLRKITMHAGDSTIEIHEGDIFSSEYFKNHDLIKVFAFNEYFDTQVNDEIISKKSLNGQLISRISSHGDTTEIDTQIKNDPHLQKYREGTSTGRQSGGKQQRYKLGTVFKYTDDIFLTALTHFDPNNRAYLSVQDFIRFLVNFWDEIDSTYAGRTVVITLFGSGITRLEHGTFTNEQILEIILWTFKLRRLKFTYPAKFVILLDHEISNQINYYKVRTDFDGL